VAVAFFSCGTEGAAVLAQAADTAPLGAVTWYGSDGTALSREILGEPRAARFAIQTGFFKTLFADVHTLAADVIRERIGAAIGGGGVHFCATAAHDAVWLAALGAAAAGTEDLERFKRALVTIADSYRGATGRTTLDAAGDRADAAYDVWRIAEDNGQYVWTLVTPRPPPPSTPRPLPQTGVLDRSDMTGHRHHAPPARPLRRQMARRT
jgi:ABC-type branched-subunit amino acid transport system substrate-binding protein